MSQQERDAITRGLRNLNSYFKRLPRTQEMTVHQLNSLDYLYRVEEDLKKALSGEKNE
jgi:hypothetical protein